MNTLLNVPHIKTIHIRVQKLVTSATAGSIDSLEMRLVLSVTAAASSAAPNYTDKTSHLHLIK
ncbi:hypothetical protein RG963_01650 [Methanosarcina sp. Z-7115]|uniref:Uncharacterized protein n=1 Tax=Methanosarcina baikalica TaxID=3073890 RepID=A0ABU2CXP5_9EURY|nr:hypothetical protein [Methanosarcina sp. Z-7115]MDR7664506.1 hypothetical protein [Methanosarcina sp. Z-7115]